jgi:hypothetical protein
MPITFSKEFDKHRKQTLFPDKKNGNYAGYDDMID